MKRIILAALVGVLVSGVAPTAAQSLFDALTGPLPTPEDKKREEMQGSPIYKKKYNKCVLNKITEVKTDMAARMLAAACHSEAELYYIKQERGAVK